jgi:hypothetical protein
MLLVCLDRNQRTFDVYKHVYTVTKDVGCGRTRRGNELPPIDTIPVGVHSVGRHGLLCWQGAADGWIGAIFHVVLCRATVAVHTAVLSGRRLTQAVGPPISTPCSAPTPSIQPAPLTSFFSRVACFWICYNRRHQSSLSSELSLCASRS